MPRRDSCRDDVIAARRTEDWSALTLLGAKPLWLDFRDAQYGPPKTAEIGRTVAALVAGGRDARPPARPLPFDQTCASRRSHRDRAIARTILWYEDAIYRRVPGLVGTRLRQLSVAGFSPGARRRRAPARRRPASAGPCAVTARSSALQSGRPGIDDAFREETLWRLAN
jgi:hypothetical protein